MSATSINEHHALAVTEDQQQFYNELRKMGVSGPIAAFHRMRRNTRTVHENLDHAHTLIRIGKRYRARLESTPFNGARIKALESEIAKVEDERKKLWEQQRLLGRALIDLAPWIDGTTTLEQRLELLNCNPADRDRIDEPDLGMVMLMAAYCTEDSAEHRGDQWNDRPLHAAVNAEMQHVMFHTPEGREVSDKLFDKLFAPGGMFEAVPRYYRQPDGTMLRQAPPLTVHDADGSRVVERKPS